MLDKLHVQEGERREALSVLLGQIDDVRAYGTDEDGVERAMPGVVMDVLKRGFEPLHFVGLGEHVLPAAICRLSAVFFMGSLLRSSSVSSMRRVAIFRS